MPSPTLIAIVGAESTGKTTLARALARSLTERLAVNADSATAPRIAWVPEWLREWCDAQGRTPHVSEQAAIAQAQHERIRSAALAHDIVVCDTTALMTAVYSRLLFNDRSLEAHAAHLHRDISLTLLTALDLPWVSDGHQRDGPQVREPVDDLLRELLHAHDLPYTVVAGRDGQRLAQAEAAVLKHLAREPQSAVPTATASSARRPAHRALFSQLAEGPTTTPWRWMCDCCVPEAERALLLQQQYQQRPARPRLGGSPSPM